MNNKENISAVTKHVFIKYMSIYDVSTCNYLTLRFYIFYYIGVFKKKEKKSRHYYFAIYYMFLQQIVQYTTKQQSILIKITERRLVLGSYRNNCLNLNLSLSCMLYDVFYL